jgi:hypothetical protein
MKQLLTVATILLATHVCLAQEPIRLTPTTETSVVITYQGQPASAPIQHAPTPVVVAPDCKTTACVTEPKKNTKVVYTSRCKEYCVPNCSLFSCFSSDCGCGDNCEKRTKNVLVKKVVPACDTTQCVLKEVPAGYCAPCGK